MFQAGDLVRIKDDAHLIKARSSLDFNPKMTQYCGTVHKVKEIISFRLSDLKNRYTLYDCGSHEFNEFRYWFWDEDWLEPFETCEIKHIDDDMFEKLLM